MVNPNDIKPLSVIKSILGPSLLNISLQELFACPLPNRMPGVVLN